MAERHDVKVYFPDAPTRGWVVEIRDAIAAALPPSDGISLSGMPPAEPAQAPGFVVWAIAEVTAPDVAAAQTIVKAALDGHATAEVEISDDLVKVWASD